MHLKLLLNPQRLSRSIVFLTRYSRSRQFDRTKCLHLCVSITFAILLYLIYCIVHAIVLHIDVVFQLSNTLGEYNSGLYWRLRQMFGEEPDIEGKVMSPADLIDEMMTAQRRLMNYAKVTDGNSVSVLIAHYGANLFYYHQYFPLATVQTRDGLKNFIDLSDKNAKCVGINLDVNGLWDLEPHIQRLNPNCNFLAFGTNEVDQDLVVKTKNTVFEKAILAYYGRIENDRDSNFKQINLLKFLDKELGSPAIDFLNSNDQQNGIALIRFIQENQHVMTPVCQLNVPIKRGKKSPSAFRAEMEKLMDELILQNIYFLMHLKEVGEDQYNFYLVNTFYEECLKQYFIDPYYA